MVAAQFPNEASLARLGEAEVRYLIVARDWLTAEDEAALFEWEVEVGWDGEQTQVVVMP
ncbi:MAG: hypothetical protein Fur0022_39880 [Anaerolineales bacterium]